MTGRELEEYLERIYDIFDNIEQSTPEMEHDTLQKLNPVIIMDEVTSQDRIDFADEELPNDINEYALSIIRKAMISDQEARHIDYSPMYSLIARYGLNISSVCDLLNISSNTRSLLTSNKPVHLRTLIKIAEFLECDPSELFVFINGAEYRRRRMKEILFSKDRSTEDKESRDKTVSAAYSLVKGLLKSKTEVNDTPESYRQVMRDKAVRKTELSILSQLSSEDILVLRNTIAHNPTHLFSLLNELSQGGNDSEE